MPSPFPGMDPYIEATPNEWAGSHNAMALKIAGSLNQSLPPGFRARCEESQLVEVLSFDDWGEPTDQYRIIPDVSTGRRSESRDSPSVAVAGVGGDVSGEVRTIWQSEPTRSLFVRIVAADAEPVCMIELLSPSNKRAGVDRQTYLREKQDLLASNVSLVRSICFSGDAARANLTKRLRFVTALPRRHRTLSRPIPPGNRVRSRRPDADPFDWTRRCQRSMSRSPRLSDRFRSICRVASPPSMRNCGSSLRSTIGRWSRSV